jgi:hypothetical protein
MQGSAAEDRRLERLTRICLALPEASRNITGHHAAFVVRTRTFAYYLNDHHGDGIVAACFKVAPGENVDLSRSDPQTYYVPKYIGPRGWVAIRLDVEAVDWAQVAELAAQSYRRVAPKRLAERTVSSHRRKAQ